jgi:rubrerythrin
MSLEALIFWYVIVMLGGLGTAAVIHEYRRRGFESGAPKDHIFRCEQCGSVYTDDSDVDRSRCPQCGKTNEPAKF